MSSVGALPLPSAGAGSGHRSAGRSHSGKKKQSPWKSFPLGRGQHIFTLFSLFWKIQLVFYKGKGAQLKINKQSFITLGSVDGKC